MPVQTQLTLEALQARMATLLPELYQGRADEVQSGPMASAGLKYDADGRIAWNEMWATFCDLAMAGGPPHKGTLLEPASRLAIEAQRDRYQDIVDEICRGVDMAAGMPAERSPVPGWIRIRCADVPMAQWLLRAVVMENVAARSDDVTLDLPAAPHFRIEKEVKNVVTVIAKTSHYWLEHMPYRQQRAVRNVFEDMAGASPLLQPGIEPDNGDRTRRDVVAARLSRAIREKTGLRASHHCYAGWLGFDCLRVGAAVWMMRALVACNVLSRREGTVLFVPIDPVADPDGHMAERRLVRVHALAADDGRLQR